ncbi:MAG: TIGR03032 family protein [Anaerolineae bacterium]|nr:TIGR03032 family protein [Anaerolineae bacterium]
MNETRTSQYSQDGSLGDSEMTSLRSVYSPNFPEVLSQLGVSLVVSTYQAGKVMMIQAQNEAIVTEFLDFSKPMGIAVQKDQLTIGGHNSVWTYRHTPHPEYGQTPDEITHKAYQPWNAHYTGDIDIHEMAWGNDGLWIVNTKYGSLCTLGANNSYSPHWRPYFLSAALPEDRCHLNGLAVVNGQPKYVTALGETDVAGGWRDHKNDGGILMDVQANRILARGLSMPHSPRLYYSKLWVLESGTGRIGWYDPNGLAEGKAPYEKIEIVAQLPGFTRGLDFAGDLAFVGLSQVRGSATFSGIPLLEQINDRVCGVWVINIHSGQTVAFLRFEGSIQEIFAVQVLHTKTPVTFAKPVTNQNPDKTRF